MTDISAALGNSTATDGISAARAGSVRDYIALLKPRVMSLVVFSGAVGLLVAPGEIHPFLGAVAVLCIAIASGAAGAINMWYDRDIDAVMTRTRLRPIPLGKIPAAEALSFGVILASFSVALMALAVNWTAALLLAAAVLFYVFIYTTWLKRRTPQNIVIGGAAGAFPPMIGWAAVTGDVSLESTILFALIFFWTPPHFWALALYRAGDYEKAGVPMLPVVAGAKATKQQIIAYSILLFPLALAPWALGMTGMVYGMAAIVLGALFLLGAVAVWFDQSDKSARRLFGFSILYLFALFAVMAFDAPTSPLSTALFGSVFG